LRREILGNFKPIFESQGLQFPDIPRMMNEEERQSNLASTSVAPMNKGADQAAWSGGPEGLEVPATDIIVIKYQPQPSLEPDTIDNLAYQTTWNLTLFVRGGYWIEVRRSLVYPNLALHDDVLIDIASYDVVKVDMVHENAKNIKLKVAPNDTTLTLWDAVTRRVQWRRTCIDVDQAVSASTIPELWLMATQSMWLERPCYVPTIFIDQINIVRTCRTSTSTILRRLTQ
jgi:hypothetical protein